MGKEKVKEVLDALNIVANARKHTENRIGDGLKWGSLQEVVNALALSVYPDINDAPAEPDVPAPPAPEEPTEKGDSQPSGF